MAQPTRRSGPDFLTAFVPSDARTAGYVTVGGLRLPYAWWGEVPSPDRPVLVLLHEGLGSLLLWRDFPAHLAKATGCPVFAYERPGHGGADRPTAPRPDDYHRIEAERVLPAVLAAVGIDRPILFGHSDGGTMALLYAAAAPDAVRAVITEAAHVIVEDLTITGIEAARAAYAAGPLRQRLHRYHGDNTDWIFDAWSLTWLRPEFRAWDIRARLATLRCPALVLQGAEDEYGTIAQVEGVCQSVAGPCEPLILPQCGHIPHHQQRAAVLQAVQRFLAGLGLALP